VKERAVAFDAHFEEKNGKLAHEIRIVPE